MAFRSLRWSADAASADSRGIFDEPGVGCLRTVEQIGAEEPTVAFIRYGQDEAVTAGMTSEQYSQQLGRLLDERAASGVACVLVSPQELLPTAPPAPSPSRFDPKIKVFSEATSGVAQSRGLLFIDMFTDFSKRLREIGTALRSKHQTSPARPRTNSDPDFGESMAYHSLAETGMHLTDHRYECAALVFRERLLGIPANSQKGVDPHGEALPQLILKKMSSTSTAGDLRISPTFSASASMNKATTLATSQSLIGSFRNSKNRFVSCSTETEA